MASFKKGTIFTMCGKEYEVVTEGSDEPSSCLVYVPRHEKDTADPISIRMWKAEAKLARGDIMISGHERSEKETFNNFYPSITDPLEQIAALKKRIHAIEERRLTLLKADDATGHVMLQDNVVRTNKSFDIWSYVRSTDHSRPRRNIQYIKLRGLILTISAASSSTEHFLFNITEQLQPCCRFAGDTMISEGVIKIDLGPELRTIQGCKTDILKDELEGKIELSVDIKMNCKYETGVTIVKSNILQCAYIRDVKAPGLKIGKLAFPEIGDHMIAVLGVSLDIYTVGLNEGYSSAVF